MAERSKITPRNVSDPQTAATRPYALVRCTTSTGKFYMRRDPWIDMSDLGCGYRIDVSGGRRVSPYFELSEMDELRRWCQNYTATHPGNASNPKEAEALAAA